MKYRWYCRNMGKCFRECFYIHLSSHESKQENRENTEKERISKELHGLVKAIHRFLREHFQENAMETSKNIKYRRIPKQRRKSDGGIKNEHKN